MQRIGETVWLITLLVVVTWGIARLGVDRWVAAQFYDPLLRAVAGSPWRGWAVPLWALIYRLTPWPSLFLGLWALRVFLPLRKERKPQHRLQRLQALFLLLLLILGPGLVVNVLLKDHLSRPRPYELIEFGGHYQYGEFWQPGTGLRNGSFPSGHAAMAFCMLGPWFVYRGRQPIRARLFLAGGLSWGMVVGYVRMAQGGHFLSDVLWAGGLIYLCGSLLAWSLLDSAKDPPERAAVVQDAAPLARQPAKVTARG